MKHTVGLYLYRKSNTDEGYNRVENSIGSHYKPQKVSCLITVFMFTITFVATVRVVFYTITLKYTWQKNVKYGLKLPYFSISYSISSIFCLIL